MILRKFVTAHKVLRKQGPIELVRVALDKISRRSLRWHFLRLVTRGNLLLREIQGSKMYLDLKDSGISKDLGLDGIRERFLTNKIKDELSPGMTCVDIGANIGYYVLMEAQAVSDKGKVYAIEPVQHNFELLRKNIGINNYDSIVDAYQLAIGSENGTAKLYLSRNSNLHNLIGGNTNLGYVETKLSRLDDFLEDKSSEVDFIRMDIEGYEYEAISGMEKTLVAGKPGLKLCLELHPVLLEKAGYSKNSLLEKLDQFGFDVKWSQYDGNRWADDDPLFDASSIGIKDLMEADLKWSFEVLFEKQ